MPKQISLLKLYRVTNELTQKELADKLDVTMTTLRSWENRKSVPTVSQILKLQSVLEVSLDDLMNEYSNIK